MELNPGVVVERLHFERRPRRANPTPGTERPNQHPDLPPTWTGPVDCRTVLV